MLFWLIPLARKTALPSQSYASNSENMNSAEKDVSGNSVRYSPYFQHKASSSQNTTSKSDRTKSDGSSRKVRKIFGDLTEEDVMQLKLPDHIDYGLDILVIGINPGLMSAYRGHHYAGPNNHFWPCLFESKLTPKQFTYKDDTCCPRHGIGLTNIVERTTRGSSDLSRKEIKDGIEGLIRKVQQYKPLIACFNGKGIYEIFSGSKCKVGRQPDPIPGTNTVVYVMPSTSGRTMSYPRARDKLPFFLELKELRDSLKSTSSADENQT